MTLLSIEGLLARYITPQVVIGFGAQPDNPNKVSNIDV